MLLSIASMSALDMVIRLKDQVVEVHTLGIRLPLMTTKTNHLAMVSDRWFGELMVRTEEEGSCRAI